ncbi:hypothetical protein ACFL5N_02415, partial [bacterium]
MTFDLSIVKEILNKEKINLVLGYSQGLNCYTSRPAIFKSENELDDLIFNYFCNHNLATYLLELINESRGNREYNEPIAVLVKPCDGKSLVELIRENKINREEIAIFSLPCKGIIDVNKINSLKQRDTESIDRIEIFDNKVKINFPNRTVEVEISELFTNRCLEC